MRRRTKKQISRLVEKYCQQVQDEVSSAAGITGFESPQRKNKVLRTVYPESETLNPEKERLLIDFDGVIHKYSKGFADGTIYDVPIEGAREALDLLKHKYEIIIFTARASNFNGKKDKQIRDVKDWLIKYDIYFDDVTAEKLPAFAYIDDLAIEFKGDWNDILDKLSDIENEG